MEQANNAEQDPTYIPPNRSRQPHQRDRQSQDVTSTTIVRPSQQYLSNPPLLSTPPAAATHSGQVSQSEPQIQPSSSNAFYNTPQNRIPPNTAVFVPPPGQSAQFPSFSPGYTTHYAQPIPIGAKRPRSSSSKTCLIVSGLVILSIVGLCVLSSGLSVFSSMFGSTTTTGVTSPFSTTTTDGTATSGTPITSELPTPLPRTSNTLYYADWSQGTNGWTGSSEWKWIKDEGILGSDGSSNSTNGYLVLSPYQPSTADYAVEAQIQLVRYNDSYSGDFGIVIRSDAGGNGYMCSVDETNGAVVALMNGGINNSNLQYQTYNVDNGYHTFRVEVKGDNISFSIDGQPLVQTTDNTYLQPGLIGLRSHNADVNVRSFQVVKL